MGMDGVILTAFILGLPANEIVLPIILMAYTAQGSLTNFENMGQLKRDPSVTWLDLENSCLRPAFLPDALALFHYPDHTV